jgi:hypothetical protein
MPGRLYSPGNGDQRPYRRSRLAQRIIDRPVRRFTYIYYMEKFLFIIREELNVLKTYSEEERNRGMREMTRWVESLAESWNFVDGEPLAITGRYVNRENIVSDGPFIESKEGISGYMLVNAENLDQAASLAQTCPLVLRGAMVIEVRPTMGPCQF